MTFLSALWEVNRLKNRKKQAQSATESAAIKVLGNLCGKYQLAACNDVEYFVGTGLGVTGQ